MGGGGGGGAVSKAFEKSKMAMSTCFFTRRRSLGGHE